MRGHRPCGGKSAAWAHGQLHTCSSTPGACTCRSFSLGTNEPDSLLLPGPSRHALADCMAVSVCTKRPPSWWPGPSPVSPSLSVHWHASASSLLWPHHGQWLVVCVLWTLKGALYCTTPNGAGSRDGKELYQRNHSTGTVPMADARLGQLLLLVWGVCTAHQGWSFCAELHGSRW